jgi:lipopolysaccharide export system protein LptC
MMIEEPAPPPRSGLSEHWAAREVDHLFRRFSRTTRFVLFSKWFLAIVATILLVVLIVIPMLEKRSGARLSFVSEEEGAANTSTPASAPSMAKPVYQGTDAKGRKYRITGGRATQITSDMIELDQVEALLENDGSSITVTADKAQYIQQAKKVELVGNVNVVHGKGYRFVTPAATVDTATMDVTGNQEISGDGPMGKLLATGFEIRDNGQTVRFGGDSRVNVTFNGSKTK